MSTAKQQETAAQTDYSTWDTAQLISRITELEQQISCSTRDRASQIPYPPQSSASANTANIAPPRPRSSSRSSSKAAKRSRDIDPSKYNTRYIALKFAYLGQRYNGYEHANGNVTALPTIEEELFKALRKSRLIFPKSIDTEDNVDEAGNRLMRPFIVDWEGSDYSKCGRTDRGVSAFGQVVGVRVRSTKPKRKEETPVAVSSDTSKPSPSEENTGIPLDALDIDASDLDAEEAWDDIADELPYIQILNSVLPEDIRILAWCPRPPPEFDARFSCYERRYRYFFTQPAFCPTPGPLGFVERPREGAKNEMREGWLDIDAMQEGAKRFIGSHDFRNFCKVDASKQIENFVRKISHAGIHRVDSKSLPPAFLSQQAFQQHKDSAQQNDPALEVYYFSVHGSAFLWHQVRHMVSMLFLVGQGLESPSIISELLDVNQNPRRPTYEIASDAPLVLWDCIFPGPKTQEQGQDGLDWVYAGDPRMARSGRGDGKFGQGGIIDDLWAVWRQRKIDEVLAGSLLDHIVSQGDNSSIARGGFRHPGPDKLSRSQKMFYGGNDAKPSGKYVPLMERRRNDTVEEINARWVSKGKRVGKRKPE